MREGKTKKNTVHHQSLVTLSRRSVMVSSCYLAESRGVNFKYTDSNVYLGEFFSTFFVSIEILTGFFQTQKFRLMGFLLFWNFIPQGLAHESIYQIEM
jgi:hypothetical protein